MIGTIRQGREYPTVWRIWFTQSASLVVASLGLQSQDGSPTLSLINDVSCWRISALVCINIITTSHRKGAFRALLSCNWKEPRIVGLSSCWVLKLCYNRRVKIHFTMSKIWEKSLGWSRINQVNGTLKFVQFFDTPTNFIVNIILKFKSRKQNKKYERSSVLNWTEKKFVFFIDLKFCENSVSSFVLSSCLYQNLSQ